MKHHHQSPIKSGKQETVAGAIGKQGSIAIMGRVILTTKQILQALPRIPLRRRSMREELTAVFDW